VISKFNKNRHTFLSASGRYIYHISIIDYLQDFNIEKKCENWLKTNLNKQGAEISAIAPKGYHDRYFKFMKDKVIIDQAEAKREASKYRRYTTNKT
jgi:hypothetical protein